MTLARLLAQDGAEVDVVMTRGAQQFVGAVTFEGVTGRRVHSDLFESGEALAHIRLRAKRKSSSSRQPPPIFLRARRTDAPMIFSAQCCSQRVVPFSSCPR